MLSITKCFIPESWYIGLPDQKAWCQNIFWSIFLLLLQCSVGDELQIRVGGDFFYAPPTSDEATNLLLIAGGVGINPLISMLQHHVWLLSKATCTCTRAAWLLYSAKNENELIFKVGCTQFFNAACWKRPGNLHGGKLFFSTLSLTIVWSLIHAG